jgi:hypothetical protein
MDEQADEHGRVVRVYDVRDLLVEIPDFDNAPPLRMLGDAEKPPAAAATTAPVGKVWEDVDKTGRQRIDELVGVLKASVSPGGWDKEDGNLVAVRERQFVVTATPAAQLQVANLFDGLRHRLDTQVTLEVRVLGFDDRAARSLKGDLRELVTGRRDSGRNGGEGGDGSGPRGQAFLTPQQVNDVMRATQAAQDSTFVTAPRVTLFNGQRAYVMVATQTAYVPGYAVVTSPAGETRYEPRVEVAHDGVVIDARVRRPTRRGRTSWSRSARS